VEVGVDALALVADRRAQRLASRHGRVDARERVHEVALGLVAVRLGARPHEIGDDRDASRRRHA
jgi:hypothetical protein